MEREGQMAGRTRIGAPRAVAELPKGVADANRPRRQTHALTIEQAAAVEAPREFRLSPDGRRVAFTFEAAGARQLFVMPIRGGYPEQITASEKACLDPQWSPDGRRLAFVRDEAIWMVDVEGSHEALVAQHPAGNRSPRWCADGHQIAFISRRRGWDQLWVVEAPVPRRGRPATRPRSPEPAPLTSTGIDVDDFVWAPDGRHIAVTSQRLPDLQTSQIHLVDVANGREKPIAGESAWETGPRWLPDGSGLLMVSDRDGWFQVVRMSRDGKDRVQLTRGDTEHGEPGGSWGYAPLPSPDGKRFIYPIFRDGRVDLAVRDLAPVRAKEPVQTINPFEGVWVSVGWLPDSSAVLAIGRNERTPDDLWLLPADPSADGAKPRQLTHSLPAVVDAARFATGQRVALTARDGLRIEGTLYLPAAAEARLAAPPPPSQDGGKDGTEPVPGVSDDADGADGKSAFDARSPEETRVPCVIHSHGGPTHQALREWFPFRQLVVDAGMAFFSVDFRGSTGYGRGFRQANHGEWGHADAFDVIDAARWAAAQPWCDGRLAHYGASYGGYMTLCVLTEEPSLWRAGVDLYGDSDIAESYRHGDRVGRIDLERQMGKPDDPETAPAYRRGSPLYRAERIEAPLLILHGRKDKRVVPLMSEKMVEALEIEAKHYQVHWYDDEPHGWQRRDNRRDAWKRSLEFLRRHVLDMPEDP
jgi:dipeptidyl aminopeptidase/acylaminoacyl peptidase